MNKPPKEITLAKKDGITLFGKSVRLKEEDDENTTDTN